MLGDSQFKCWRTTSSSFTAALEPLGFPGPAREARVHVDKKPVPNCPGLRPKQFGTGFWSMHTN